jgi:hypothetical protein
MIGCFLCMQQGGEAMLCWHTNTFCGMQPVCGRGLLAGRCTTPACHQCRCISHSEAQEVTLQPLEALLDEQPRTGGGGIHRSRSMHAHRTSSHSSGSGGTPRAAASLASSSSSAGSALRKWSSCRYRGSRPTTECPAWPWLKPARCPVKATCDNLAW